MTFISIIVPVYNIRKFVSSCVESVRIQNLDSWEIILVDDCSNDGSDKLCEALAASDPRITFLRTTSNSGPGVARNVGLAKAQGEYIFFLDGDDTITVGSLSHLMQVLSRLNYPDMIRINYAETFGRTPTTCPPETEPITSMYATSDFLRPLLNRPTVGFRAWEFLYRKNLLQTHNLLFSAHRVWEDNDFVMRALFAAASVAETSYPVYNWRIRLSGTLTSNHAVWWDQMLNSAVEMLKYGCTTTLLPWQKEWALRCVLSCITEFEAIAGAVPSAEIEEKRAIFDQLENHLELLENYIYPDHLLSCIKTMGTLSGALAFRQMQADNAIRMLGGKEDLFIFGFPATRKSSRALTVLEANGYRITGMLDNDPNKQGLMLDGLPIFSPDVIPLHYNDQSRIFIIVSTSTEATGDILSSQLAGFGLEEGLNFSRTK